MSSTTTRSEIAIRFDVLFGGVIVRECCDDDLGGRLHLFAPSCACDLRTVEITFPVLLSEVHERQTREHPGWHSCDMELDRFRPATVQHVDGEQGGALSCLLPAATAELYAALTKASEAKA